MCSVEISLEIFREIEKALDLGYNLLYVNVDNLENGFGLLRVLSRQKSKYIIVYEDILTLDVCYQILNLLGESEYDIKDFTIKFDD